MRLWVRPVSMSAGVRNGWMPICAVRMAVSRALSTALRRISLRSTTPMTTPRARMSTALMIPKRTRRLGLRTVVVGPLLGRLSTRPGTTLKGFCH